MHKSTSILCIQLYVSLSDKKDVKDIIYSCTWILWSSSWIFEYVISNVWTYGDADFLHLHMFTMCIHIKKLCNRLMTQLHPTSCDWTTYNNEHLQYALIRYLKYDRDYESSKDLSVCLRLLYRVWVMNRGSFFLSDKSCNRQQTCDTVVGTL